MTAPENSVHEGIFLYVNTLMARGGTVTFSQGNLVFEPTTLEKVLGAKSVTVSLAGIKKASVEGILAKSLIIVDKDRVYKFMGKDLQAFLTALNKAIYLCDVKEI